MKQTKKCKGKEDYDYKHDILFFKVKEREYHKSLEFEDIVLDIDKKGSITGMQIFDASKLFKMDKNSLRQVKEWELHTKVKNNVITVQLMFEVATRNKVIIERGQNLIRESASPIKDSEIVCRVEA